MKLTLDHTQRLNLHALLGAQRADVGSIRTIWAVQDKIALLADEETAVELKRKMVAGQERMVWNADLSLPAKAFEFSDAEAIRISSALQEQQVRVSKLLAHREKRGVSDIEGVCETNAT